MAMINPGIAIDELVETSLDESATTITLAFYHRFVIPLD